MKKQLLTLGLIGFLLWPVREALHITHIVCDTVGSVAEHVEIRLHDNNPERDTIP